MATWYAPVDSVAHCLGKYHSVTVRQRDWANLCRYCGNTTDYCGTNCQQTFGDCTTKIAGVGTTCGPQFGGTSCASGMCCSPSVCRFCDILAIEAQSYVGILWNERSVLCRSRLPIQIRELRFRQYSCWSVDIGRPTTRAGAGPIRYRYIYLHKTKCSGLDLRRRTIPLYKPITWYLEIIRI